MINQVVSKRYAVALFGAAKSEAVTDRLLEELETLHAMNEKDPLLVRFLESPSELDEHKEALVDRLFSGRACDLFVRYLKLLLAKKRTLYLQDSIRAFRVLVEESKGITEARVTTAVPLSTDLAERLQKELGRLFTKKVRVRARTDPRVIGGIVVMVEGKIIDRSVRSELAKLREDLLSVRVH